MKCRSRSTAVKTVFTRLVSTRTTSGSDSSLTESRTVFGCFALTVRGRRWFSVELLCAYMLTEMKDASVDNAMSNRTFDLDCIISHGESGMDFSL